MLTAWIERRAKRSQARADRTGTAKHRKRAWFWRSLAQWVRGGDWQPYPDSEHRSVLPQASYEYDDPRLSGLMITERERFEEGF